LCYDLPLTDARLGGAVAQAVGGESISVSNISNLEQRKA